MRGSASRLWGNNDGTVAPTVALSLIGLIAVGGVAFDYAHLASMDTELQQAADQAAIAAATQLDGQTGAIARATAAAQSLIGNKTLLAGGGAARLIDIPTITFCSAFDDSIVDTAAACTTTTDDKAAKIVWVRTGGRTTTYSLTPIVGLFNSGSIAAEAVAGMNSAVCKEPPVMMCNPNANPKVFNVNDFVGKGILLIASNTGPGGSAYAPGDFGFLDVGSGGADLKELMGYGSPPDKCVDITQPSTEPGNPQAVIDQFNTRFDIYESGDSIGCFGQSKCAPSINSTKDLAIDHGPAYNKTNCGLPGGAGGNGWRLTPNPYRPTAANVNSYTATPDLMGYPRDKNQATSAADALANRIGSGDWDIDAYWRVNHPFGTTNGAIDNGSGVYVYPTSLNTQIMAAFPVTPTTPRTYPTRYQVYRWEMLDAANRLNPKPAIGTLTPQPQPVCQPGLAASTPGATTPDRRILPIAVVDCTGLTGKKAVNPIDWVESFLVEPSLGRSSGGTAYTNSGDIYVEIVRHVGNGTGGSTAQFVRHDRPYLIR